MLGGPMLGAALHEHRVLTAVAQPAATAPGDQAADDDEPVIPRG
jgi:hypothetical protein